MVPQLIQVYGELRVPVSVEDRLELALQGFGLPHRVRGMLGDHETHSSCGRKVVPWPVRSTWGTTSLVNDKLIHMQDTDCPTRACTKLKGGLNSVIIGNNNPADTHQCRRLYQSPCIYCGWLWNMECQSGFPQARCTISKERIMCKPKERTFRGGNTCIWQICLFNF